MAMSAVAGRLKLLERGHVLSALRSALGEAAAGRGRFVLVAGEAGVGKTAVVREFCDEPGKPGTQSAAAWAVGASLRACPA